MPERASVVAGKRRMMYFIAVIILRRPLRFSLLPAGLLGGALGGLLSGALGGCVENKLGTNTGQGASVDATALRFKQFPRTALNGEVELYHEWSKELGKTRVLSELTFARNLDRGVKYAFALPAVPSDVSIDAASLEERNFWVRIEQDLTEWVTLGVRFDTYTPDDSIANNARDTYSFVAAVHFTKGLQWMLEFDHAIDNVHRANGVAPSKQIETLSNVLQARF